MENVRELWADESGQGVAEYAVMLAVILLLVMAAVRFVGTSASNAFERASDAMQ